MVCCLASNLTSSAIVRAVCCLLHQNEPTNLRFFLYIVKFMMAQPHFSVKLFRFCRQALSLSSSCSIAGGWLRDGGGMWACRLEGGGWGEEKRTQSCLKSNAVVLEIERSRFGKRTHSFFVAVRACACACACIRYGMGGGGEGGDKAGVAWWCCLRGRLQRPAWRAPAWLLFFCK